MVYHTSPSMFSKADPTQDVFFGDAGVQNHHISVRISCFMKLFGLRGIYQQKDHVQNVSKRVFSRKWSNASNSPDSQAGIHVEFLSHGRCSKFGIDHMGFYRSIQYIESEKGRQRVLNTAQMGLSWNTLQFHYSTMPTLIFHIEFTIWVDKFTPFSVTPFSYHITLVGLYIPYNYHQYYPICYPII